MSGGAGYLLSQAALSRVIERGYNVQVRAFFC